MLAQVGGHFAHLFIMAIFFFKSLPAGFRYQRPGPRGEFLNFLKISILKISNFFQIISKQPYTYHRDILQSDALAHAEGNFFRPF
jgi:hypothetical protein